MGILSSGGKGNSRSQTSSTTTTNTTNSTINTVDNRAVQGDNAVIGGNVTVNSGEASRVSVQQTDLGAVQAGLDIALESLSGIQSATNRVLDFGTNVLSTGESLTKKVIDSNNSTIGAAYSLAQGARQSETSGAINNFLKYAAIIAGIAIAGWALVKTKGKI